jgi:glycine cleavage system transcriptional repressor
MKTQRHLLTAAGRDRPGLVAAVTKVLFEEGCNLEDSAMTRLQGEFAMLLIFSGPFRPGRARSRLMALGKKLSLTLDLRPLSARESRAAPAAANGVLITVYGADRAGIVHRITDRLARARVNISDLSTHRTESDGTSGYILYLEGEAPRGWTPEKLEADLRRAAADMGVTVQVKALSAAAL